MPLLYFDNNATTFPFAETIRYIAELERRGLGNPSAQHRLGQKSRGILERSRESIVRFLGGESSRFRSDELVFVSCGTEANNLILQGWMGNRPGSLLVSEMEHPSILRVAEELLGRGESVHRCRTLRSGQIDLDDFRERCRNSFRYASVMWANNETGVIQPIEELAAICREFGVLLHSDASQAVAKIPVSFGIEGLSSLTISPHKFHGPIGIGGLLVKPEVQLKPLFFGGFQQAGMRPGTEAVALAAGFAHALETWETDSDNRRQSAALNERRLSLARIRDLFEQSILARISEVVIHGINVPRVPSTSLISFLGVDRQQFLLAADVAEIACSTGSACASGSSEPSSTLLAMGCSDAEVQSAIRFSFGLFNTEAEVLEGVDRISRIISRLRK